MTGEHVIDDDFSPPSGAFSPRIVITPIANESTLAEFIFVCGLYTLIKADVYNLKSLSYSRLG
jgi:hypothetical protein